MSGLTRLLTALCTAEVGVKAGVMVPMRPEEFGRPPGEVEVSVPVGATGDDCAELTRMLVKNGS